MKKEKRQLTLKQLEILDKIANKVLKVASILVFSAFVIMLILMCINVADVIISILMTIWIILFIVTMISFGICEITEKHISLLKKQMKLKVLKQLGNEHGGYVTAFVSIKDEEVITDILSKNIVKIVIDNIEGPNLVTSIQLTNGTWQTQVYISSEKLISILDENSKKEMLDHLIKYIKIGNLEAETTEVTISGSYYAISDFYYYINPQTTDEELLEIFELKK